MGYNIGIGEAIIDYQSDDNDVRIDCEAASHPDAPDLGKGDISGKGNFRYPSYTAFSNWVDETGLRDVFYFQNEDRAERRAQYGMRADPCWDMQGEHPGCAPLQKWKYERVKAALDAWKQSHPNSVMPTPENTEDDAMFCEDNGKDYTLGRLVWFEFWMRWALENCKNPIIYNS